MNDTDTQHAPVLCPRNTLTNSRHLSVTARSEATWRSHKRKQQRQDCHAVSPLAMTDGRTCSWCLPSPAKTHVSHFEDHTLECCASHRTHVNQSGLLRLLWSLLGGVLLWVLSGSTPVLGTQPVQMGWWEEFSLARFFDSPIIFATVMGMTGLFILFSTAVALWAASLERAAAAWAGYRGLPELVAALDGSEAQLAFVRIRRLRSERLYTWLLKRLPGESTTREVQMLLADLPDDGESKRLKQDLPLSQSDKNTRRQALLRLFERRDEQLQRLLMARLREVKDGGSVSEHLVYLLEDLDASEARPFLERLLGRGEVPESILRNALRRIPEVEETKAK